MSFGANPSIEIKSLYLNIPIYHSSKYKPLVYETEILIEQFTNLELGVLILRQCMS